MPLRQTTGFVQSLLRLVGLDWTVPNFSTLCRRKRTLNVSIPYRGSKGPLNLLIDSTGIKVEGEGEWNAHKHGGAKRRCCHPTPQKRQAVETDEPRRHSAQRSFASLKVPGTRYLATMERLSPPKPCRDQDELHQAAWSVFDGERLRSPGRGTTDPHCSVKRIHCAWRTRHSGRRVNPSGERVSLALSRFVQQGLIRCSILFTCVSLVVLEAAGMEQHEASTVLRLAT